MQAGPSTRQLADELGPALLRLVAGAGADRPLTGVLIHDPAANDPIEPGCVVLGVGVTAAPEIAALARDAANAGAHALAVKGPVTIDDAPLPILEVNTGASWMHVATTIRERLLDHARARVSPPGEGGDLFTVANAISMIVRAPVTIEDQSSAVLAWSSGQEEADDARVETILGRAVQSRWLDTMRERGVFRELHTSSDPVYVEPVAPGMLARVAIAVRAGSDFLGSVWAAVAEPLDDRQCEELKQVVPMVALHLVNARADTTRTRQRRRETVAAALGGGPAGVEAGLRLHLGQGPFCVLAAGARHGDPRDDASAAAELHRFEDGLDLYLTAVHAGAGTVSGDGEVYAVLGWPRCSAAEALASSRALARDFLARSPIGAGYVIAVGGPVPSLEHLATARGQADAVLRSLRHEPENAVGTLDDTALPILLRQLADTSAALGLPDSTGPLRALEEQDGPDGVLTETLAVYLDSSCVAETAAAKLHVHVNTLRYRLRRIRALSGLDFADADAVLLAHLQLRMKALGADDNPHPRS